MSVCQINSQQERPCILIQVAGIKRNWEASMKGLRSGK